MHIGWSSDARMAILIGSLLDVSNATCATTVSNALEGDQIPEKTRKALEYLLEE